MNKKGVALIIGCLIVVIAAVLSLVVFSRSVSEKNLTQRAQASARAFWAAEAALETARAQLDADWDNRDDFDDSGVWSSLGNAEFRFFVETDDAAGNPLPRNFLRVVAEGRVDATSGVRSIEAVIQHIVADSYKYAVLGKDKIELKPGTTVHGDMVVDGSVEVQAGATGGRSAGNGDAVHGSPAGRAPLRSEPQR